MLYDLRHNEYLLNVYIVQLPTSARSEQMTVRHLQPVLISTKRASTAPVLRDILQYLTLQACIVKQVLVICMFLNHEIVLF